MKIKKIEIIILAIIIFSFIAGFYFYHLLPDKIATHFNIKGEPDGYMSKFFGIFLIPFLLSILGILFFLIPRIDPLKSNIEKFKKYYDGFIFINFIFIVFIQVFIILWNLGIRIRINLFLPVFLGILFFYCGILCENSKRNWFVGIKTPWTLTSEKVWDKTHKLGGRLFKIAGILTVVGTFFQRYLLFFILIPLIFIFLYTMIYSYLEYRKEIK